MIAQNEKLVVVTGSASGIGLRLCQLLIQRGGYYIFGLDIKSQSSTLNPKCYQHVNCDLRNFEQTSIAVNESGLPSAKLFSLVNAAGIMPSSLITAFNPDIALDAFKINSIAPLYLSKLLFKPLARAKGATIVNITSIAADIDIPGETIYCSTKSALKHATRSMAIELSRFKIKVNAVAPALINTGMTKELTHEQKSYMLTKQILPREITVDDVAEVIISLIEGSDLTTGSTYYVGGVVR